MYTHVVHIFHPFQHDIVCINCSIIVCIIYVYTCTCIYIVLSLPSQHDIVAGVPTENLLSAILEALAEPAVSYIGLSYDTTVRLSTGE